MRDLTRSVIRFSWATGLLGASRLAGLVAPAAGATSRARRSNGSGPEGLNGATWAAQGQLGELLQAVFQAGCELQDEGLELCAGALSPRRWPGVASRLAGGSLDTLRIARPDAEGALARQELKNKLEVYRLVKGARAQLGHPPPGVRFSLEPYVARAHQLDAYRALWLLEGLGHDYAETALRHTGAPRGLLRVTPKGSKRNNEAVAALPASSRPMLHGGLGLALAEHLLGSLSPASSTAEVRRVLERFVELCRVNSTARHVDSAIESLGIEARCFFPDLVPVIERGLQDLDDQELHRFFWHGAGRGLYFAPVNFIPGYGSLRHVLGMARREAPGEEARHAALAGVACAFTMVNLAQPAILERMLRDLGEDGRERSAVADGVAAAIDMRHQITPDEPALCRLVRHRPAPALTDLWREMVGDPCRRASGATDPDAGEQVRPEVGNPCLPVRE